MRMGSGESFTLRISIFYTVHITLGLLIYIINHIGQNYRKETFRKAYAKVVGQY